MLRLFLEREGVKSLRKSSGAQEETKHESDEIDNGYIQLVLDTQLNFEDDSSARSLP